MKHLFNLMVAIAAIAMPSPAWTQSQSITYSFSPASAAGVQGLPSRAPGADALRWLGGLGTIQIEPKPATIAIAPADRQHRQAYR
jgi:hypothetical protein